VTWLRKMVVDGELEIERMKACMKELQNIIHRNKEVLHYDCFPFTISTPGRERKRIQECALGQT